jgi:hypothetical protein
MFVIRHIDIFGLLNRHFQAHVAFRVSAAGFGGHDYFPPYFGEYLAPLGINRSFLCLMFAHLEMT